MLPALPPACPPALAPSSQVIARRRLLLTALVLLAALSMVIATSGSPAASGETAAVRARAACTVNAKLVPSCGVLWGAAPAAFDYSSRVDSTARFESLIGRGLDIYHGYKVNAQPFPNQQELDIANGAKGTPRLLHINWRPATDLTWAQVVKGRADARIDKEATFLRAHFRKPFFLTIWHEPEHYVDQTAGSGMTADDYRRMVRHTIRRLEDRGVTNAVFVQVFQGFPKYAALPWWPKLYPGDAFIDWIASDSYNSGFSTGYNSGGFDEMVNRTKDPWRGFYRWATQNHPTKPLMLAEWGVYARKAEPARQAWFFDDVRQKLDKYPAIKAMSYFNAHKLDDGTTRIDATDRSLTAYRRLTSSIPRVDLSNVR